MEDQDGHPGLLDQFKEHIQLSMHLIKQMTSKDKLVAIDLWNDASESLQQVLNVTTESDQEDANKASKEAEASREKPLTKTPTNETDVKEQGAKLKESDTARDERKKHETANDDGPVEGPQEEEEEVVKAQRLVSVPVEGTGDQQLIVQIPEEMIASADVAGTAQIFTARLMGDTNNSTDMVHLMITNEAVAPEAKASASCDGDNKQQQQQQIENTKLDAKVLELEQQLMERTETVSVDENPPLLDEAEHRVLHKLPDGTHEEVFECEICHKNFFTPAQLTAHRWHHSRPFKCDTCDERFSAKGNLVVHRRKHTGEKPFGCKHCDSRFSTRGNQRRHERTHTGQKPWECPICKSRYTEKKSLNIHMRKHTGERPYACDVCGKRFAQSSILNTHKKLHENQRRHLCHLCGKAFAQKSQLKAHNMRHDGVKKFKCSSCDFRFMTKADLDRHERIHTGERPYSCDLCVRTFSRVQSLKEHKNRHYGLKPYKCQVCGKAFAEMSSCSKHVKTHKASKAAPDLMQHLPGDTAQEVAVVVEASAEEKQTFEEVVTKEQSMEMADQYILVETNEDE